MTKRVLPICCLLLHTYVSGATDLTIHLPESQSVSRQSLPYICDDMGSKIGLPSGPFLVEYINGGGNSLVVVPISGNALIFSSVSAGSGARYAAQQYTWLEVRGAVLLVDNSINGKLQSTCQRVARK